MPHQNLTLFQGDILDIQFKDEFFDISLCLGVLQHTPDTSESIKELSFSERNFSKPKGIF